MTDWQIGDLALCVGVKRKDWPNARIIAKADKKIRRVDGVRVVNGNVGLFFAGWPSDSRSRCWNAASFRKVHPDKHEQCEPEFVTLLKHIKPKVPASGMSLRENNEDCSRPKAGSPARRGRPMTTRQTRKEGDR